MQTLRKLRNRDTTRVEEPMNTPKQHKEKHATQQDNATDIIEKVTNVSGDDMIPIGHPLRKQTILTFKQYASATGFLPESIDLSELNDRQLADYAMIAERQSETIRRN